MKDLKDYIEIREYIDDLNGMDLHRARAHYDGATVDGFALSGPDTTDFYESDPRELDDLALAGGLRLPGSFTRKLPFTSDDVIQGRDLADLGEYGGFRADYILVDPARPDQIQAVGTLETLPDHLEEPVNIPATLDVDLGPFWDDPDAQDPYAQPIFPPPEVVETLGAVDFFNAPWRGWTCDDIPADWKF